MGHISGKHLHKKHDTPLHSRHPLSGESSLRVRESSPRVRESSPQVRESSPQARESSPQVRESSLQAQGSSPRLQGSFPRVRGASLRVRGSSKPKEDNRTADGRRFTQIIKELYLLAASPGKTAMKSRTTTWFRPLRLKITPRCPSVTQPRCRNPGWGSIHLEPISRGSPSGQPRADFRNTFGVDRNAPR